MQNTQTSANKKLKPAAIRTGSATNLPADAKSSAVVKPENAPDPSPGKVAVTRAPRLKAAAKLNSPKDRVTSKLTIITPATGSRATAAATAARSTNGKTTNSGNPLQAGVPATKTKAVNTHSATSKHAEAPAAAGRTAQRRGNNARRISNTATATADSPETATEPALRLPARAPETVATLPPNAPQKGRFSDDDPRGDKGILLSSLYPDKKNATAATAAPTSNEDAGSEEKLPAPTSGSGGGAAGAAASGENTPPDRARWEGGVKLGYEMGFSSSNINKVVLAPYVQYNINNRAAVVFQPAYKSGRTRFSAEAGAGKAYYNVIGAPTVTTTANVFSIVDSGGNITNDTLSYKQLIQQTYDSVVITRSLSNSSYWEVELPLLFSYQLSPIFSVMAGPVFSLGRKFSYADNRVTYTVNRAATMDSLLAPITGVDYTNYFTQGTPPLSSYTPESGTVTSAMGLGYLAGVKAGVGMLSAELMVQQRISGIPDAREAQARKALAQPYFRLSIGIRLFGNRKNDNSNKPAMEEMPYRRAEQ